METKENPKLNNIVKVYCQLDALRAKKFIQPDEFVSLVKEARLEATLQETFIEWKFVIDKLRSELGSKLTVITVINGLQRAEILPLILYLVITGAAMVTSSTLLWQAQTIVAIVVFLYLAGDRLANYLFVTRPVSQAVAEITKSIPTFDQKIHTAISKLIEQLNNELLTKEISPNNFKHTLYHLDYPGLYYRGKLTMVGPKRLLSMPFPIHQALSKYQDEIRIIMARLDEKLIKGLEKIPEDTQIKLVTLNTIARQTTFNIFISGLYKAHPKTQVVLLTPPTDLKGIQILTQDSTWELEPGRNYNESRYQRIHNSAQRKTIETTFEKAWSSGRQTKIKSK